MWKSLVCKIISSWFNYNAVAIVGVHSAYIFLVIIVSIFGLFEFLASHMLQISQSIISSNDVFAWVSVYVSPCSLPCIPFLLINKFIPVLQMVVVAEVAT